MMLLTEAASLNAAGEGGAYVPHTSSMRFELPIPDEFPFLDFGAMKSQDIAPTAALLEEFAHRFQVETTHFGCLYRLACLIQTLRCLDGLRWLAGDATRRLPMPWTDLRKDAPAAQGMLDDIRALEVVKRLVFGFSLNEDVGTVHDAFARTKDLVHEYTPMTLRHFGTWAGLGDFYDESGRFKVEKTTRAILESHGSAYAFSLLREAAPDAIQTDIEAFIAAKRRGLYETVEQMSKHATRGEVIDLHGVLRLGDYAMDASLFDIPTVPPPGDYVASTLPYARYRIVIEALPRATKAATLLGHEMSLADAVEAAVYLHSQQWVAGEVSDETLEKGRRIQLERELEDIDSWLEHEEEDVPLDASGVCVRREIARTCSALLRGTLPFHLGSAKFAPNPGRLGELCRVCDLPFIEYPDGFELFRCYPREIDSSFMAWRVVVHGTMETAAYVIGHDLSALAPRAQRLEQHGIPSISSLAQSYGFDVGQLA